MVPIGVSQREDSLQLLFASLSSTFSTAALKYFSADIKQYSVPFAVSIFCIYAHRYISGTSALTSFNLNTDLIPSIVPIDVADIDNTSST